MKLSFKDGIIEGRLVRDIQEVWPITLKDSFKQRKTYDEYYYVETDVVVTLEDIQILLDKFYEIRLMNDDIIIYR